MFLQEAGFCKMVKKAHKENGLRMGMDNGFLVVTDGHWRIQINREFIPNKAKAALVEAAGELPEEGEHFIVIGDTRQEELGTATYMIEAPEYDEANAYNTEWMINDMVRIFQKDSLEVYGYPANVVDKICARNCESEKFYESLPVGPYIDHNGVMYVKNNIMQLQLSYVDLKMFNHVLECMNVVDMRAENDGGRSYVSENGRNEEEAQDEEEE